MKHGGGNIILSDSYRPKGIEWLICVEEKNGDVYGVIWGKNLFLSDDMQLNLPTYQIQNTKPGIKKKKIPKKFLLENYCKPQISSFYKHANINIWIPPYRG